jgi:protein transport protein SEC31
VAWNPVTGAVIGDIHRSSHWAFDAQFCTRNPDLVCVASYDGKVTLHSLQGSQSSQDGVSTAATASSFDPFSMNNVNKSHESSFSLKQPPKWLRRPVGCAWGFGNRLVTFSHTQSPDGRFQRSVQLKSIAADGTFFNRAHALDIVKGNSSTEALIEYCKNMASTAGTVVSEKDKEVWRFLAIMFETGARSQVLDFLGFDTKDIGGKLSELLNKLKLAGNPHGNHLDDNTENEIAEPEAAVSFAPSLDTPFKLYRNDQGEESDIDTLLTRSILLGDFKTAVEICLGADRLDDAFMFAVCGGNELLSTVQQEYIRKHQKDKSYARILQNILKGELNDIVDHVQVDGPDNDWKDVLALICTYAKTEDLSALIGGLGRRLESLTIPGSTSSIKTSDWKTREEKKFAALLCYLGSGDLEKVLELWTIREAEEEKLLKNLGDAAKGTKLPSQSSHSLALQSLIEKIQIYRQAIGFVDSDLSTSPLDGHYKLDVLYQKYIEYANAVANQGLVDVAWKILQLIPYGYKAPERHSGSKVIVNLEVLKDRIFNSGRVYADLSLKPEFPYEFLDIAHPPNPEPIHQNMGYPNSQYQPIGYGQSNSNQSSYQHGGQYNNGFGNQYQTDAKSTQPPPPIGYNRSQSGFSAPPPLGISVPLFHFHDLFFFVS